MPELNPYLAYKRDTSRLVYWIVKTSNAIIAASLALSDELNAPRGLNANGRITVAEFVSLSKLIAKHVKPSPQAILHLFEAVIQARTTLFEAYSELAARKSDPKIERSNASQKHFIDALSKAFDVLGGAGCDEKQETGTCSTATIDDEADLDQLLLSKRFAALSMSTVPDAEDEEPSDSGPKEETRSGRTTRNQQKKRPSAKAKKAKPRKASGNKSQQSTEAERAPGRGSH
ncbi:hypothetical protein NKR19_g2155 [Coniochaeta hoffmannii]|uniref:DUF6604 domain-containing protein n=1 Tax=Coniochaeta hoffmannii TaxID=91930 RepID=A0AA38SBA8_9PEZI|nr:hypothetical protein NKR19_g2155 [Coniochaeta hoffmannii]